MSISEFSRAASTYQRRSVIACTTPFLIAFAFLLVYAPLQHRFEVLLQARLAPPAAEVLSVLPVGLPLVLALLLLIPLARRIDRRLGVPCPHCGKMLANFKAIVIASRNCPHCGRKVVSDEG